MPDTRDIAIQTRADVQHLSAKVDHLVVAVDGLKEDLQQRRGAERLARLLHTLAAGSIGAGLVKAAAFLGALPK